MNLLVERLKRLPQSEGEIWQGGLVRMPAWVDEEDSAPFRPWIGGWVSTRTKLVKMSDPAKDKDLEQVLISLVDFACDPALAGYRPAGLDVRDAEVADYLSDQLVDAGIVVEQRKTLYTWDRLLEDFLENISGQLPVSEAFDAKGVTVEAMRGFAQAACEFYRAASWRHLDGEDLIQIESPFVDAALRYVSVLGSAGLNYGLGFYESPDEFHEIMGGGGADGYVSRDRCWVLFFDSIVELPFGDADLWQDHDFPVAQPEAYPLLMCAIGPETFKRPGPDVLAFVEGLLRALAQTGEEQMDAGRWKQEVTTCEGDMTFELGLPDILEGEDADSFGDDRGKHRLPDRRSMERTLADINRLFEGQDFDEDEDMNAFLQSQLVDGQVPRQTPKTPLEEAQDIMYDAFDSVGRRQLQLIRKALAICPDCADAHVLLAERCHDPDETREHYQRALESAERTLGSKVFEKDVGHFWGNTLTRPYMRARLGLGMTLDEAGRLPAAAEHYRELLRLNPNDNQGVRDFLLPVLIKLGANKEATQLLKRYKNDIMAVWNYSRALLTFREKGNTPTARKHLGKAIKANPYVPPLLLAEEAIIETMNEYTPGSREEAVYCAKNLKEAWEMTEGALEWLDAHS